MAIYVFVRYNIYVYTSSIIIAYKILVPAKKSVVIRECMFTIIIYTRVTPLFYLVNSEKMKPCASLAYSSTVSPIRSEYCRSPSTDIVSRMHSVSADNP